MDPVELHKNPHLIRAGIADALHEAGMKSTLDLCLYAIFGGPPEETIPAFRKTAMKSVCDTVSSLGAIFYRCTTCGTSPNSCVCIDCFKRGPHRDHDFTMFTLGFGGSCDCGDLMAWRREGFCCAHKGYQPDVDPVAAMPADIAAAAAGTMTAVLTGLLWPALCSLEASDAEEPSDVPSAAENAAEVLEWLCMFARLADGTRRILCTTMLQEQVVAFDSVDHVPYPIALLHVMPKAPTSLRAPLLDFYLELLNDTPFKCAFVGSFSSQYAYFAREMMVLGSRKPDKKHLDNLVTSISAQLYSSEDLALRSSVDGRLLDDMLSTITTMFEHALTATRVPPPPLSGEVTDEAAFGTVQRCLGKIDACSPLVSMRYYWSFVNDFDTVMEHSGVAAFALSERPDLFDMWLHLLARVHGMRPQVRLQRAHLERDNDVWQAAFTLEDNLVPVSFDLVQGLGVDYSSRLPGASAIVKLCGSNEPTVLEVTDRAELSSCALTRNMLRACAKKLELEWEERGLRQRLARVCEKIGGHLEDPASMPPVRALYAKRPLDTSSPDVCDIPFWRVGGPAVPVSLHLPLHRMIALIVEKSLEISGGWEEVESFEDLFNFELDDAFFGLLCAEPLMLLAHMAQVRAGLWVRNSGSVRYEEYLYRCSRHCARWMRLDLLTIQTAACLMDPNDVVRATVATFGVEVIFDQMYTVTPMNELHMAHECLTLLLQVALDRMACAGLPQEESVREEVIQYLAVGDFTHSVLVDLVTISKNADGDTCITDALNAVATFHTPTQECKSGFYALKPQYWSKFDPLFTRFSSKYLQQASDRYTAERERRRTAAPELPSLPAFPEPERVKTHCLFSKVTRLLVCDHMGRLFGAVLCSYVLRVMGRTQLRSDSLLSGTLSGLAAALECARENAAARACLAAAVLSPRPAEGLGRPEGAAPPSIITLLVQLRAVATPEDLKEKRAMLSSIITGVRALSPECTAVAEAEEKLHNVAGHERDAKPDLEAKRAAARARQQAILARFRQRQETFMSTQPSAQHEAESLDAPAAEIAGEGAACPAIGEEEEGTSDEATCVLCLAHSSERSVGLIAFAHPASSLIAAGKRRGVPRAVLPTAPQGPQGFGVCERGDAAAVPPAARTAARDEEVFAVCGDLASEECMFGEQSPGRCGMKSPLSIHSCGHHVHVECHHDYIRSLQTARTTPMDEGVRLTSLDKQEFLCPLCRRLGNVVIPLFPRRPPPAGVENDDELETLDWVACCNEALLALVPQDDDEECLTPSSSLTSPTMYSPSSGFADSPPLVITSFNPSDSPNTPDRCVAPSRTDRLHTRLFCLSNWPIFCPPEDERAHALDLQEEARLARDKPLYSWSCVGTTCGTVELALRTGRTDTPDRVSPSVIAAQALVQAASQSSLRGLHVRQNICTLLQTDDDCIPGGLRTDPFECLLSGVAALLCRAEHTCLSRAFLILVRNTYFATVTRSMAANGVLMCTKEVEEACILFLRRAAVLGHVCFLSLPLPESCDLPALSTLFHLPSLSALLEHPEYAPVVSWAQRLEDFSAPSYCLPVLPSLQMATLPPLFQDLFSVYGMRGDAPALCLFCGALIQSRTQTRPGQCTAHAAACSGGLGCFLLVRQGTVLLLRGVRGAFWGSLYLDSHGESDPELRRGKALYLQTERYAALLELLTSISVDFDSRVLHASARARRGRLW